MRKQDMQQPNANIWLSNFNIHFLLKLGYNITDTFIYAYIIAWSNI